MWKRKGLQLLAVTMLMASISSVQGQNFTSYFTGDTANYVTTAQGGVCLMGGATEDDNAMRWFLERCNGGDVLVLRASGSNGYNAYLYSQLGVSVNSVETIVCHAATASTEGYIHQRIQEAEGIWFAGGDQWNYVSYWRGTAIDSLVNDALQQRNIVIGGTSAGMAILGGYYFSAQNGTVTSATAMSNPYAPAVAVDSTPFLNVRHLEDVITDTHYDYYDRKGRHTTFLARILTDSGNEAKGIACDEYTAVCMDTSGIARVFGDYPDNDDNAYFVQVNCEVPNNIPEVCMPNLPLQWDHNSRALKVYVVKGTAGGTATFDLRDWQTGSGGEWEHWWSHSAALFTDTASAPACGPLGIETADLLSFLMVPNPTADGRVHIFAKGLPITCVQVRNSLGQIVFCSIVEAAEVDLELGSLGNGLYWVEVLQAGKWRAKALMVRR